MTLAEEGPSDGVRRARPGSPQHGADGGGAARVPHPRRARGRRASRPISSWSSSSSATTRPTFTATCTTARRMERAAPTFARLWTFGKNFLRARGGLREGDLPARVSTVPPDATFGRGGTRVEGTTELAPDDPALVGPLLTDEAYQTVLASDLGRFYRPARRAGSPGRLATDARESRCGAPDRDAGGERDGAGSHAVGAAGGFRPPGHDGDAAGGSLRYGGLSAADIDPDLPNALFRRVRGRPAAFRSSISHRSSSRRAPPPSRSTSGTTITGPRGAIGWRPARSSRFLAPLVCAAR